MPFVLKNLETGEIASAVLRNVYDLDYYGAEWWLTEAEAQTAASGRPGWAPHQVSDSKLKVFNVKLNNDAGRKLFLDDNGVLRVHTSSAG